MSRAVRKTFNIVRQVSLDDSTLKKVAEALGIPEHEHERIIGVSGEIHIAPPAASGGGEPAAGGGGRAPSGSGGATR